VAHKHPPFGYAKKPLTGKIWGLAEFAQAIREKTIAPVAYCQGHFACAVNVKFYCRRYLPALISAIWRNTSDASRGGMSFWLSRVFAGAIWLEKFFEMLKFFAIIKPCASSFICGSK
jgi:hypothetical protein